MKVKLSVFYESKYWTGLFEETYGNKMRVAKTIFYKEPSLQEILDFIFFRYKYLQWTSSVEADMHKVIVNPKRRQRQISKDSKKLTISTKSQIALQELYLKNKEVCKKNKSDAKKLQQKEVFALKQIKKKQKHKGR